MSIIRAPRPQSNFYLLDKRISEDKRLSWAARGLLIFLLGKPDHWRVSVQALINETADSCGPLGRDGVRRIINDLKDAGYITCAQSKQGGGEFGEVEYVVSESPLTDYPATVEPATVNPLQVSTDSKKGLKEAVRIDSGKFASEPARGAPKKKAKTTAKERFDASGFDPLAYLKAKGVDDQVSRDWVETRELNRGIACQSVIDRHEAEAEIADVSLEEALIFVCCNSVFDFTAEKYFEYAT
jgi:hypothetical protein